MAPPKPDQETIDYIRRQRQTDGAHLAALAEHGVQFDDVQEPKS